MYSCKKLQQQKEKKKERKKRRRKNKWSRGNIVPVNCNGWIEGEIICASI